MSQVYNLPEDIDYTKFVLCQFEELVEGTLVRSITMTYSQKYFLMDGCEDYNAIKTGILVKKDINYPYNSLIRIMTDEGPLNTCLYVDPGTSGCYSLYKYLD
jgi:hypothetical protein